MCLPITDLINHQQKLRAIFEKELIYPDLDITDYAGDLYYTTWDLEKAIELSELAAQIYPEISNRHSNIGYYYYIQGDYDKSLKSFNEAIKINNDDEYSNRYYSWIKFAVDGYNEEIKISSEKLKDFAGDYGVRHITLKNNTLYYNRDGGKMFRLVHVGNHVFALYGYPGFRIRFEMGEDNKAKRIIGLYISGFTSESGRNTVNKGVSQN